MRLVVAVEPDGEQAERLRRIIAQQPDTQLILVASPDAAVVAINRQVPDLVLLGASLAPKAQESVITHFCSVSSTPNPQTLNIPPLASGVADTATSRLPRPGRTPPATVTSHDAFVADMTACLARAEEQRTGVSQRLADAIKVLEYEFSLDSISTDVQQVDTIVTLPPFEEEQALEDEVLVDLESLGSDDALIDPETHYAELALLQAQAEERLATALERVTREAAEQRATEVARLQAEADETRRAEVAAVRAAAAREAQAALSAEIEAVRDSAEQTLAAQLARVRAEAEQHLEEQRQQAEALRARAVDEARAAAEQAGNVALKAEVQRITVDAEERLTTELRRAQDEAERTLRALQQTALESESIRDAAVRDARAVAEEAATRALDANVARIHAESVARVEAEVAHARQEAEQARMAQQRAETDAVAMREAAAQEARAAAEAAAARALEAEVARTRAEAEARLRQELDQVRASAEEMRLLHLQAQLAAEGERDAVACEVRAAAEAIAAQTLEAELTRARAEAGAHLRDELERVREETQRERMAGEFEIARARRDAESQARALADATLVAEIARAQAEAEARLAAEVSKVRAAEELRRTTEVEAIRAQFAEGDRIAREHARAAAADTVVAEVARAELTVSRAAANMVAPTDDRPLVATAPRAGVILLWIGGRARATLPVAWAVVRRIPVRAILAAAAISAVALASVFVDVAPVTRTIASSADAASGAAAAGFGIAAQTVHGAIVATMAPDGNVRPFVSVGQTPTQEPVPAAPLVPGLLAVSSRVPLELRIAGRRIGTTDDAPIMLAPGRHHIELISRHFKYRETVTVNVPSGAVASHTVSLPNGSVHVDTDEGAEILIEGERVGVAPHGAFSVPIGTREIVVRDPELGERRQVVEIRYGEIAEVTIPLRGLATPPRALPWPPGQRIP